MIWIEIIGVTLVSSKRISNMFLCLQIVVAQDARQILLEG